MKNWTPRSWEPESSKYYLQEHRPTYKKVLYIKFFLLTDFFFERSWDEFYLREKSNFQENPNDTGECWFSDSNAQNVMIRFLELLATDEPEMVDEQESTFLDLGTGNGQLLIGVREAGFEGLLTGLDYSAPSIEFARGVYAAEFPDEQEGSDYEFLHADFLASHDWNTTNRQWDVVLDKGTLDAIALADIKYGELTGVQAYPRQVSAFARQLVLITSCNFTEQELIKIMTRDGLFEVFKTVPYPTFEFGGVKGQTVCTIAFTKTK